LTLVVPPLLAVPMLPPDQLSVPEMFSVPEPLRLPPLWEKFTTPTVAATVSVPLLSSRVPVPVSEAPDCSVRLFEICTVAQPAMLKIPALLQVPVLDNCRMPAWTLTVPLLVKLPKLTLVELAPPAPVVFSNVPSLVNVAPVPNWFWMALSDWAFSVLPER